MLRMIVVAALVLFLACGLCNAQQKGGDMAIEKGKQVSFDYTLKVDGEVVDSSKDRSPLEYVHGEGKIIPGLSRELEGMKPGEEKKIKIQPADAYGEVKPDAVRDVPRENLPEGLEAKEGMMLQVQTPSGGTMPVKITEVKDESVTIDFNHPLAGKTLHFDVKVVSVR
jgi:FKBP-type peptidyl-prolyl cis-trans isomerase 2